MKRPKIKWVVKQVAKKLLHPQRFFTFLQLLKKRNGQTWSKDDPQLTLYSKILVSGFLHYGYFNDPEIIPKNISLHDIEQAQLHYAEFFPEYIEDKDSPVLDCGCGMGGLIELLLQKNFNPVALTPDRAQIQHIKNKYPEVPLIEGRFEDLPVDNYRNFFGTVITSESLQYLHLDKAFPVIEKILKPGGRWIACDYFRIDEAREISGHRWCEFNQRLGDNGWKIVFEKDITANILPTLAYLDMLGSRIGIPLFTFLVDKLEKKRPAISYLVEDVAENLQGYVHNHLDTIKPETFAQQKKYIRLVMERS